ncbi:helix-turn-helix transcriptional regulator [Rhodococcus triatomae]|nr:helix-turn-helix transcriptional regulator [Rhodococcus triatomae]QNG18439.1 helix-turn-helix transcriptional regulator [Rhodococcus triatomae]QNG21891.1 helix-turn-helix transcriptional regulator [Rhodococcus triatomae]
MPRQNWGQFVRENLQANDMTHIQLASALGISPSCVQAWCSDRRPSCSEPALLVQATARALGVSPFTALSAAGYRSAG